MNTNSNVEQPGNARTHSANQSGVKPFTFLGTVALSIALLGVTAGWLGHKPPVQVTGEVEATNIKMVPQVANKIQPSHVRQGEKVREGQLLVSLENQDVQTRLGQDCAATTSTNELKQALRDSCVEDICMQSNCWVKAKAVAELAQQTVDRSRELQAAGVMSLEELKARERDFDLARSSEQSARANFELAVALCGEVERLAAAAEHADQAIAELKSLVAELSLTNPIDGEAQRQPAKQGESVTPGSPVLSVVNLQDLWVRFNLPEDLLANVSIGTTFCVRVPSLANQDVPVKVNYIAPTNSRISSRDRKTFEVRAVPVHVTAGLRPGMSVLADWSKFN